MNYQPLRRTKKHTSAIAKPLGEMLFACRRRKTRAWDHASVRRYLSCTYNEAVRGGSDIIKGIASDERESWFRRAREYFDINWCDYLEGLDAILVRARVRIEDDDISIAHVAQRAKEGIAMGSNPNISRFSKMRGPGNPPSSKTKNAFIVAFQDDYGKPETRNFDAPDGCAGVRFRNVALRSVRHRDVFLSGAKESSLRSLVKIAFRRETNVAAEYRDTRKPTDT